MVSLMVVSHLYQVTYGHYASNIASSLLLSVALYYAVQEFASITYLLQQLAHGGLMEIHGTRLQGEHTINDEEAVDKVLHLNTPDQVLERLTEKTELGDKFDVRFELAATFGTLQFESLKMIDNNLKIMVAGAISEMNKLNKTSWESLLDSLDRIPYLEMVGERTNFTEDEMSRVTTELLDFSSGEVDYMTVFFTELWFDELIQENMILSEMNINITSLAYYLGKGEQITIKNALLGSDIKRKALMDLAILRFPDIMNPYLTVFMLRFDVLRNSLRLFVVEQTIAAIRCRFNVAKYVPNEEYIKQLREDTRETLMKDIDTLFGI
ncbi:uncharacterized protein LOC106881519 [Octopus bimaculoides]|nr:uncharacterized protein LOC106881519 [Octopus bimaculoides]